ncbi:MAG TPA: type II CAAX endopeptidase family protein [Dehalococcoidia bacterium]|jgi:membrane protease YdiL (CAAX protease family)
MAIPADSPPAPPEFDSERVPWTGRDVVAGIAWLIGIFIAEEIIVGIAAVANGSATSNTTYAAAFIVGAIAEVGFGAVAIAMTAGKYGGGLRRLGVRPITGTTMMWAGFAFVGGLVISFAYGAIIQAFHIEQLQSQCAEQIPDGVRHTRWLLALASVVVIACAPVFEELFFRGFVFPGLARVWGVVAAIIVSALLFSGAHLDYKSFIPIAGVGMVFAFTYWRSGNIFSTMFAHCAFNSTSIAFIAGGSCDSIAGRPAALFVAHLLATLPPVHWL